MSSPGQLFRWLPAGVLVWLLAVVYWLTWAPFRPRTDALQVELALLQDPFVLGLNLVLLVPVAVVVALFIPGGARRRIAAGAGAALLVSLSIEAGQMFVEGRNVTAGDVLFNVTGATLGALGAVRLSRRLAHRVILLSVVILVFAGVSFHAVFSSMALVRGQTLEDWDFAYPILVGDEVGVDRRYVGQIVEPEICAVSLEPLCLRPGASAEDRVRLVAAVQEAQALRLSASVVSESDVQSGPARIVTFSTGWHARNATLAQEGRDLILRVRTPLAGPNGSRIEWVLPDAVATGQPTRTRAEFISGAVTMYAKGQGKARAASFHPGLLQAWRLAAAAYPDFLSRRLSPHSESRQVSLEGGRVAIAVPAMAMFLPLGFLMGGLLLRVPVLLVLVTGLMAGSGLLYLVDAIVVGLSPPAFHLALAGVTTVLGTVLFRTDSRNLAGRNRDDRDEFLYSSIG